MMSLPRGGLGDADVAGLQRGGGGVFAVTSRTASSQWHERSVCDITEGSADITCDSASPQGDVPLPCHTVTSRSPLSDVTLLRGCSPLPTSLIFCFFPPFFLLPSPPSPPRHPRPRPAPAPPPGRHGNAKLRHGADVNGRPTAAAAGPAPRRPRPLRGGRAHCRPRPLGAPPAACRTPCTPSPAVHRGHRLWWVPGGGGGRGPRGVSVCSREVPGASWGFLWGSRGVSGIPRGLRGVLVESREVLGGPGGVSVRSLGVPGGSRGVSGCPDGSRGFPVGAEGSWDAPGGVPQGSRHVPGTLGGGSREISGDSLWVLGGLEVSPGVSRGFPWRGVPGFLPVFPR